MNLVKGSNDKGVKQQTRSGLINDRWVAEMGYDAAETKEEKRAYAVLWGLINSMLMEMEGKWKANK